MAASFIVKDVRIFTGEEEIESGHVIVENGLIKEVGKSVLPAHFKDIPVISKPNHTLLPGFIDAHVHIGKFYFGLAQALRFGVTTVCDMHSEAEYMAKARQMGQEDKNLADIKYASLAATIEGGWPVPVVTAHDKSPETAAEIATWPKLTTEDDVRNYIQERIRDGASYIKLMHESGAAMGHEFPRPTEAFQRMIVEEAHNHGFVAVAHATSLEDTLSILRAGVDGLTHTFCDKPPTKELVEMYKKNGAYCNPTLTAMGSLTKEGEETQKAFAHDERVKPLLGEKERERMCQCMGMALPTTRLEYACESVRQLKAAGIDIVCGSDAALPAIGTSWGLSVHHELFNFVKLCNFTPFEALRSATSVPARRLNFQDRGVIAKGRLADLVLVEGNPLHSIEATLDLRGVWREGVLCDSYKQLLQSG